MSENPIPPALANTELMRLANGDLHVMLGDPQPLIYIEAQVCRADGSEAPDVLLGLDRTRAVALIQMLEAALKEMP
ncbi:MAG: hypothetical protein NVS3B1_06280 [Marmoricola sp.]